MYINIFCSQRSQGPAHCPRGFSKVSRASSGKDLIGLHAHAFFKFCFRGSLSRLPLVSLGLFLEGLEVLFLFLEVLLQAAEGQPWLEAVPKALPRLSAGSRLHEWHHFDARTLPASFWSFAQKALQVLEHLLQGPQSPGCRYAPQLHLSPEGPQIAVSPGPGIGSPRESLMQPMT